METKKVMVRRQVGPFRPFLAITKFLMAASMLLISALVSIAVADSGNGAGSWTYTGACPAGQVGTARYVCRSNTSVDWCNMISPSVPLHPERWTMLEGNCTAAVYYVSTQTETQWLSCPANTPSGSIYQTRTYELWSDGSARNYSGFSVYNSCYNIAPTAGNFTLTTDEDVTGYAAFAISDDGPGPYTFQILSAPASGSASVSGNTLVFVPSANWNGTTSLTYRVMDGAGAWSGVATATIVVRPVNDAPVAYAKTLVIDEDTTGTVTLTATDIDSPVPTVFQVVTPSPNGTATITGSTLSFSPNLNWNGTTTLTYRAQDSAGAWSAPVTVTITVNPVNDVPTLTGTTLTIRTKESTPITVRTAVSH